MAITRKSTVRECLADERATRIINEITGNFGPDNEQLGPVAGMKLETLLRFPQSGVSKEDREKLFALLEAEE